MFSLRLSRPTYHPEPLAEAHRDTQYACMLPFNSRRALPGWRLRAVLEYMTAPRSADRPLVQLCYDACLWTIVPCDAGCTDLDEAVAHVDRITAGLLFEIGVFTTRNDYGGMKCRNIHAENPGAAAAMLEHADKLDEKAIARCAGATFAEIRRIEDERQAKLEKRRSAYRARKAVRAGVVLT